MEGEGQDPVKPPPTPTPTPLKTQHTPPVIHYWPFRGGIFIVVLFVNCYIVFHFLMFYF